jgi:hypothetical protein
MLGALASASASGTSIWIVHNGVDYLIVSSSAPVTNSGYKSPVNMLLLDGVGATTFVTSLVDENGDPFIYLSAGDSIAASNNTGIPSSGSTSGTYYFYIIGQAY